MTGARVILVKHNRFGTVKTLSLYKQKQEWLKEIKHCVLPTKKGKWLCSSCAGDCWSEDHDNKFSLLDQSFLSGPSYSEVRCHTHSKKFHSQWQQEVSHVRVFYWKHVLKCCQFWSNNHMLIILSPTPP